MTLDTHNTYMTRIQYIYDTHTIHDLKFINLKQTKNCVNTGT